MGVLLADSLRDPRGFELVGAAEALRSRIGSPRPPTLEEELAGRLAAARAAIGAAVAEAAVEHGRTFDLERAVAAALEALAEVPPA